MRGYSPIPVRGSRAVVNHLIALLKRAYPQALALIGEDPAAPLPPAFLRRRPSPLAAKKTGIFASPPGADPVLAPRLPTLFSRTHRTPSRRPRVAKVCRRRAGARTQPGAPVGALALGRAQVFAPDRGGMGRAGLAALRVAREHYLRRKSIRPPPRL